MACRVYRNTKFGIFRERTGDFVMPTERTDASIAFRGADSSVQSGTSGELDIERGLHTGVGRAEAGTFKTKERIHE